MRLSNRLSPIRPDKCIFRLIGSMLQSWGIYRLIRGSWSIYIRLVLCLGSVLLRWVRWELGLLLSFFFFRNELLASIARRYAQNVKMSLLAVLSSRGGYPSEMDHPLHHLLFTWLKVFRLASRVELPSDDFHHELWTSVQGDEIIVRHWRSKDIGAALEKIKDISKKSSSKKFDSVYYSMMK